MTNIIETINSIDHLYAQADVRDTDKMIEYTRYPLHRSYFFTKLSNQFNMYWFEFAYHSGLLSFDQIPGPIKYQNAEGNLSFGFRNWEGVFPILEAAKAISKYPEVAHLLLTIADDYIDLVQRQVDDMNRNFTVDYYICRVILLLPLTMINPKHLSFIADFGLTRDRSILSGDMVGTFFNRALEEDQQLAMDLLDLFFTPDPKTAIHRIRGKIDDYTLENFTKSEPPRLYDKLGNRVVEWALNKLRMVSIANPWPFLKFELPSLEPDSQNSNESEFNFSILRLVTGILSSMPISELVVQLSSLLIDDQPIMRRIAYHLIDLNYKQVCELFWEQPNPLNEWEAKLEIYRLINRNCTQFGTEQVKAVVEWIDTLKIDKENNETEADHDRHLAYRKLEWYLALEPVHYKYPELLIIPYNKFMDITQKQVPNHPGYDSYFTFKAGGDYSQSNRILSKPAIDVLNILANEQKWDGYNIYGLQQDVRDYVIASYSEITKHLNEFEALPIPFIYNFMDGLRTIAEKTGNLDISETFGFLNRFIDHRKDLWDFSVDGREKSSSIGMIAWLFNTVVRNYDYILTQNDVKSAINALLRMEDLYTLDFTLVNEDPVGDIINSTRGKIYDALVKCSIREVKILNTDPFWNEEVEELFSKRLKAHSGSSEFFWSVGFSVPQISYLDLKWLKVNKDLLMDYKEKGFDKPVFYGYLLLSAQLYTNLFELFYDIYLNQLSKLTNRSTITRRYIEHIWVAFSIDLPNANQLIGKLIELANSQQLTFLMDRVSLQDEIAKSDKIRYIWGAVLPIAEKSANIDLRNKVFDMVYLAEFLTDFVQTDLELFVRTLALGSSNIASYRLLKIIEAKLKAGKYELAGQLLKNILENVTDDVFFDEDKLISIVEDLYQNNQPILADQIAVAAVKRANFRLVSIYNTNHSSKI